MTRDTTEEAVDYDAIRKSHAHIIRDFGADVYDKAVEHVKTIGLTDKFSVVQNILSYIAGYSQACYDILFNKI